MTGRRSNACLSISSLEAHAQAPQQIILDLDATDDPLHGHQEGRFFHGYYDCYCYLPLYVFCGRHLLAAKLRPANIDGSAGAIEEAARLIAQIRGRWPEVRILLRADSGFARDPLMAWCENNGIDYLFGLAKSGRLVGEIESELATAAEISRMSGRPARRFKDFAWRTLDSWSCERRVVAKAEWTGGEANPRFVVTSLSRDEHEGRHLYEKLYCARGDMENRIKRVPARPVFRPHLGQDDARQSAALVVRLDGLCPDLRAALHCPRPHSVRPRHLRHDPPQAAEDRCPGAYQRAPVKLAMPSAFPYQAEYRAAHAALTATSR